MNEGENRKEEEETRHFFLSNKRLTRMGANMRRTGTQTRTLSKMTFHTFSKLRPLSAVGDFRRDGDSTEVSAPISSFEPLLENPSETTADQPAEEART
jgi:hypothetical protein